MKKAKILASVVFMIAISVISFDTFAAVQTQVINIDLKTFEGVTSKYAAKEYNTRQKWASYGAINGSGKTTSIKVNIKRDNYETGWKTYPYISSSQSPYENTYSNDEMKVANKTYEAQIKTAGFAITTYHTSNLWYISY